MSVRITFGDGSEMSAEDAQRMIRSINKALRQRKWLEDQVAPLGSFQQALRDAYPYVGKHRK